VKQQRHTLCRLPGRLNVLANVVRKPMRQIFNEFTGKSHSLEDSYGTGDVKYHLGTSYDRPTISGGHTRALAAVCLITAALDLELQ
jgi:2-oxoglutarate dehydrogenase complex dehydrogenase (E1) component-like enzyme